MTRPASTATTRALVVANGELPSRRLVQELAAAAGLVIAADGGADRALAAGVEPSVVVGDLDSVSDDARQRLAQAEFLLDDDEHSTDLEKAVRLAVERGATRVDVVAAGGARADHALANLSVIVRFRGKADVHIVDDLFDIRLVDGEATVDAEPGTVVSLVAIGTCSGLTTSGLRWDLDGVTLDFSPRGIHNEVRARPATVRIAAGTLLLFEGRWVEPHR
jgi:thiamine pyrophosphokinase